MSCVGKWFSPITLLIIGKFILLCFFVLAPKNIYILTMDTFFQGTVLVFSVPRLYEDNQVSTFNSIQNNSAHCTEM
jgi:hypothetical protein